MISMTRNMARPSAALVLLLAGALLTVGYGDGLAAGLQLRLSLASPWIVVFVALFGLFAGYLAATGTRLTTADLVRAEVVIWWFAITLALQFLLHGKVNMAGYMQLALFVVALVLVRALFANAPDRLIAAVGPSAFVAHVVLAGYVVIALVVWNASGVDLSIRAQITGSSVAINDYYGYRPAAWGAEPAWTAIALAVSYSATYYLMPSARGIALVLTAVAAIALQSGTLFLFLFLVVCGLVVRSSRRLAIPAGLLMVAALLVASLGSDRLQAVIQGRDPSLMMRSSSALVAIDVVARSFPLGVGYGNFRDDAVYGSEFDAYLDLDQASYYKSDVMILNFAAELGLAGPLLLAYVFRVLGFGRLLLPTIILAMQAVLSGTVLIPALLVLAVIMGCEIPVRRQARAREGAVLDRDGASAVIPHGFEDQMGAVVSRAVPGTG